MDLNSQSVLVRAWDMCVYGAILLSVTLVALACVFPTLASEVYLLLYALDLICWGDISRGFLKNPPASQARTSASARYGTGLGGIILLLTAPWELVFPSASIVEGALPLLWGLRLFRVVQLNSLLYKHELFSLQKPGLLRLIRLLVNITIISHCLACAWLLLGFIDLDASWLARANLVTTLHESQYIRAFYWTITTMTTVGYGDITPGLDREYLFASLVMLVGASFYAYIIGNVASLVGQLNASKSEYLQRAQFVTRYLYEQNVPPALVGRVQDYYHNRWEKYRSFDEEEILSDLPRPLTLEIKTVLAKRLIDDVPLFKHASQVIREHLLSALQLEFVDPGSVIAREGERNRKLIFIVDGELEVTKKGNDEVLAHFGPGDYFGNYSLILDEPRSASVTSKSYCELMYLHRDDYEEIKELYPEFLDVMKKAMAEHSEKMSDLVLQGVVL